MTVNEFGPVDTITTGEKDGPLVIDSSDYDERFRVKAKLAFAAIATI